MSNSSPDDLWRFDRRARQEFDSANLDKTARARLLVVMRRVVMRQTRRDDVHPLGDNIFEVRSRYRNVQLRLLFTYLPSGEAMALGLRFITKKTRKVPRNDIAVAARRRDEWLQSQTNY